MRKISFLVAIIGMMIAIVPTVNAQNMSFAGSGGVPFNESGPVSLMDPHVELRIGADFASHYLKGYIAGYGGNRFSAILPGKTLAMKDTLRWGKVNTAGLGFGLAFCIPQTVGEDNKKLNPFRGEIFAMDWGPSYNAYNHVQAGAFRIHLQGNYMFTNSKKTNIGIHLRLSYNFCYLSLPHNPNPLNNFIPQIGFTIELPDALGGSEE